MNSIKLLAFNTTLFFAAALNAQYRSYDFMREITRGYEDFSGAMVVQQNSPLYKWPDVDSPVLEKPGFQTAVEVLETGTDAKQKHHWYKVKAGEKTGYMLMEDLATQSIYNPNTKTRYFVLQPSPFIAQDSLRITAFDTEKNVFTDTLWETGISAEAYFSLYLQPGNLKGAKNILVIRQIMPYCGGGIAENYYADTGTELVSLFSTFSGGDIGYIHTGLAWLPVKTASGKVEMVALGEGLSGYALPRGWSNNIPKQELVVVQMLETEYELGEDDMPVKDEQGNEKKNITVDVVKYYRWDGHLLRPVKTFDRITNRAIKE